MKVLRGGISGRQGVIKEGIRNGQSRRAGSTMGIGSLQTPKRLAGKDRHRAQGLSQKNHRGSAAATAAAGLTALGRQQVMLRYHRGIGQEAGGTGGTLGKGGTGVQVAQVARWYR